MRVGKGAILSPHGALRAYTVLLTAEPLRGSPMSHLLQYRHGLHISDVRVGRGYLVTAWRTTCLYGVTYSRASPRLPDGAPSSVPARTAHLRCASGEGGYHVTAWRTSCLYGVTYSRASSRLPDSAPYSVPVRSAHLRCASGKGGYLVTAWRTTCLYGVTYSRASSRLPDGAPSSVPDTVRLFRPVRPVRLVL